MYQLRVRQESQLKHDDAEELMLASVGDDLSLPNEGFLHGAIGYKTRPDGDLPKSSLLLCHKAIVLIEPLPAGILPCQPEKGKRIPS